jgi:hypothetical protein
MYPVKLGYTEAVKRVRSLLKNGHDAEALLTSMFTVEKTLYRTLRQLIVSAGFPSSQADTLMGRFRGIENIKQVWACFDPKNEPLSKFIPQTTLKIVMDAQTMRNNMVHGKSVYKLADCRDGAKDVLKALDSIRSLLESRYGCDGWSVARRRIKNTLHADPRVKT